MIELFPPRLRQARRRGDPNVLVDRRAVLVCGCCAWVGRRMDTMAVVMQTEACSDEHVPLVRRFQREATRELAGPLPEQEMAELADRVLASPAVQRTA